MITYPYGATLPQLLRTVRDENNLPYNFSSGWTFEIEIEGTFPSGAPQVMQPKTTGVTGSSGSPNVTIAWATSAEITTLMPGNYQYQLIATRTSDSRVVYDNDVLQITGTI